MIKFIPAFFACHIIFLSGAFAQVVATKGYVDSAIETRVTEDTVANIIANLVPAEVGTNKQDIITATGSTNLLTAPETAGGQPGIKPVSDFATASQGEKADNAVPQTAQVTIPDYSTVYANGTILGGAAGAIPAFTWVATHNCYVFAHATRSDPGIRSNTFGIGINGYPAAHLVGGSTGGISAFCAKGDTVTISTDGGATWGWVVYSIFGLKSVPMQ